LALTAAFREAVMREMIGLLLWLLLLSSVTGGVFGRLDPIVVVFPG
jgi:hypothetical protein